MNIEKNWKSLNPNVQDSNVQFKVHCDCGLARLIQETAAEELRV